MKKHIFLFSFLLGSMAYGSAIEPLLQDNLMGNNRPYRIHLISPESNLKITRGPLTFSWEPSISPDSISITIQKYEVTFWSNNKGFRKTFEVNYSDSVSSGTLQFDECRKVFKRHGRYFWRVRAFTAESGILSSDTKSFQIKLFGLGKQRTMWIYPYAVQFQYLHHVQTDEYLAFLRNIDPNIYLRSYSEIGLIFKQDAFLFSFLTLQECFFIQSNVGLGGKISAKVRLFKNDYFALYPRMEGSSSWYSYGLAQYNSTAYYLMTGFELAVMPKGHIVLKGNYVPVYRIHYQNLEDRLRTVEGFGWEFGVQLTIPQSIIAPFNIFGLNIELQRIPLGFSIRKIHDQYTDVDMEMRRFSISYHFR